MPRIGESCNLSRIRGQRPTFTSTQWITEAAMRHRGWPRYEKFLRSLDWHPGLRVARTSPTVSERTTPGHVGRLLCLVST